MNTGAYTIGHGHIGDGNLYLNCIVPGFKDRQKLLHIESLIQPFVFSYIKEKKGSISAEHGIGR